MKKSLLKGILYSFYLTIVLLSFSATAQNIFSGEPVQVVGQFNGYVTTPYNSDYRTTGYRRVSTPSGTPTDGRGQWATTMNAQSSGGNFTPINMSGGGGNGFLFISGPSGNRFQNKWVFSGVGQGTVGAINGISAFNSGNDMGLNMSTAGRYTFVFNDCGYIQTNAKYYVGYTSNAPVTVSRISNSFTGTSGKQILITISSSATPSSGENVYLRYRVGTNDFSTGTSVVQAAGSGTSWTATLPEQSCGTTIFYYVYTSTRTLAQINADSESDRSLAVLRYDDNAGANYSVTLPSVAINWHFDFDGDGFGDPLNTVNDCLPPVIPGFSYVTNNLDCNDIQTQYTDADGDGFGVLPKVACGGVTNNSDCDDTTVRYADVDGDGFGSITVKVACGGVINNTDCNDNDILVWQTGLFYLDADGDNYSPGVTTTSLCYGATEPSGFSLANLGLDCDDTIAAINPGQAEILYDGVDNNCNGQLDEGFQITTTMQGCGTTLTSIGSLMSAVSLGAPITGYRFEVTTVGSFPLEVQVVTGIGPNFSLTQLPSYAYATTYSIRCMLQRSGIWLGYYGPACNISSPAVLAPGGATAVTPSQCGITLPTISTLIATTSLAGATGYKFRVTNQRTLFTQELTRSLHWFSLTMLTQYNYGDTYTVEVAVKTTGAFSGYGSPCDVTAPPVPSLTSQCSTIIPAKTTNIATSSLALVTSYDFEVKNMVSNAVSNVSNNLNWFRLNMITNYAPSTQFRVRVRVLSSGIYSDYGDACFITSPAFARTVETLVDSNVFEVTASPNPFDTNFGMFLNATSTEDVSIRVYDMIGKLIEQREVKATEVVTQEVGNNYPSGVYNVIVSQGSEVKTLRVIKR